MAVKKGILCTFVALWALAINHVNAMRKTSMDEGHGLDPLVGCDAPKNMNLETTARHLKPAQKGDSGCSMNRLSLKIVGEQAEDTPVQYLLEKLHGLFRVRTTYGPHSLLFLSTVRPSRLLESLRFFRRLSGAKPVKLTTKVKELGTTDVFVGRLSDRKRCNEINLKEAPLKGLPLTENGIPLVVMEAASYAPKKPFNAGYPSFSFLTVVNTADLLTRMLPMTDRLFWVLPLPDYLMAKPPPEKPTEHYLDEEKRVTELDPNSVYLYTREQLELLFPNKGYYPVRVLDSAKGAVEVDLDVAYPSPAAANAYVCTGSRRVQLSEPSWAAVCGRPGTQPGPECDLPVVTKARLLVARPGGPSENNPQIVLLKLRQNTETQREHWVELKLTGTPYAHPPLEPSARPSRTFSDYVSSNSRFISPIAGVVSQSVVSRLFLSKVINAYNINKEELLSVFDEGRPERASSLQTLFTRPMAVATLRPIDPKDVLVAPVDATVQSMIQYVPQKGNIVDKIQVPQDYHRVHSPADWTVTLKTYIPGCTPSVHWNTRAGTNGLDRIERTALTGYWDPYNTGERLFFSVVLVGATFVGGIQLAWEEAPTKPRQFLKECSRLTETYEEKIEKKLCLGEELGSFRLGSTVAVVYESPPGFDAEVLAPCDTVRVGQTAGRLSTESRVIPEHCRVHYSAHNSPADYLKWLRENRQSAGEELAANTQLPSSWRTNGEVAFREFERSLENSMLNVHALAQYLYHYSKDQRDWEYVVLGQPGVFMKFGGEDSTLSAQLRCIPALNKRSLHLELQGRYSSVSVNFRTEGDEPLLFKEPSYGCDGNPVLGTVARGIYGKWSAKQDGILTVKFNMIFGTGSAHRCVEPSSPSMNHGEVSVTARCTIEWGTLLTGTATSLCAVENVDTRLIDAQPFDVTNQDLRCDLQ